MNCEHCKELLPARERAELPPQAQAELEAHLHCCAACSQAGVALRELNALLDTDVTPSPGLRRQLLACLEQEAVQMRAPRPAFSALFAKLWPSRPLGAFSYSLALVVCGMFGGQMLPGAGTDFADVPAERLYQLCAVPDGPPAAIL